jgi:hypothetical protein
MGEYRVFFRQSIAMPRMMTKIAEASINLQAEDASAAWTMRGNRGRNALR